MHLFSVVTDKKIYPEFEKIRKICRSVKIIKLSRIRALVNCLLFFYLPSEVAYCFSSRAKKEILKYTQSKKFDVIYLKRLRSAVFLPEVVVPVVIDSTDAMSMFYDRMSKSFSFFKNLLYKFEAVKYKIYEKKIVKKYKLWIVCSSVDKQYLESLGIQVNVYVVPNPVDTEYFNLIHKRGEKNVLLFRGLMDKSVNVDAAVYFAEKIMPTFSKRIEDLKLVIVGPKPAGAVKRLANNKNIFVLGYVDDVRTWLRKSYLSVCPVRIAAGTRFKILQSWAAGRPVVSTTIGADGLDFIDGQNLEIADTPREFSIKITKLIENQKHYNKLVKNGRRQIVQKYSFLAISRILAKVFVDVKAQK